MKRSYIGLAFGALITLGAALILPSCGHDQKLVSLQVQPSSFTFLTPDSAAKAQFSAIATYIHPPATKDVTSQATWAVDTNVVTVSAGSVSPSGNACGGADVRATIPAGTGGASNIVVGYATVTVDDPTSVNCPGGNTEATLSVQVTPVTDGSVTSLTYGINCPSALCIAVVPVGGSVALTATPTQGHSFLSWTGCTTMSGNSCTVTVPTGGAGVVATFD